jgi:exosortase
LSQAINISNSLSADGPAKDESEKLWGLPLSAWVQIAGVAVLFCLLFRTNLARLWGKTNPIDGQDSNWQHSVFVPLIGIYYLYIHREELLKAKVKTAWGGLLIMLGGMLMFLYGIYPGQNDYVKDLGMVVTLFGTVSLLCGWEVMKVAWFPIAFLIVALPWPELVYSKFAWPLQKLAASVAVGTLRLCGVTATNFGTKIMMYGQGSIPRTLNVAEACAGLRSLMTFLMVAGTVAFLSNRPLWEKLVMTLFAIPIAIFCNVVRVTGQGLLDHYVSQELSQSFAHQFVGLIMLIPGFFLILLVGWILDKLFIEEAATSKLGAATAAAAANRRTIVEKKKLIAEAAPSGEAEAGEPAAEPVVATQPAGLRASVKQNVDVPVQPTTLKPSAPRAIAASPVAQPSTLKPSAPKAPATAVKPAGLKPSAAVAKEQVQQSGLLPSAAKERPQAAPASGLKPSSKPAAARANLPQASGLKPSAAKPRVENEAPRLKPSAPKPPQQGKPSQDTNEEPK